VCGIVGYVGPEQALPIVLEGLRRLEYRGYDSAGVAVRGSELSVVKRAGKLAELEAALADGAGGAVAGDGLGGRVAMGHTRWATHGAPTDRNAHPHVDCAGRFAVIHNGIIENFQALRDELAKDGHTLRSDTDTEVVAHLLEDAPDGDLGDAVRATIRRLTGAYALVVMDAERPDVIVGVKVSSPMIVGIGDGENMLASGIPAVLQRTKTIVPLDENQVVEVRADSVRLTGLDGNEIPFEPTVVDWTLEMAQKGGYQDFMLKEIHEQPAAIADTLRGRVDGDGRLELDDLSMRLDQIRDVNKVFVVACGTAYHSGLVAKYAIEHWVRIPVEIDIASEFRYRDPVLDANTLTLGISQSGETIDTLEAVRHARHQQSHVLAITNTVGSAVTREASGVMYTHAGPEIGVAATKTFATQMAALHLVALYLAQTRGTLFPDEVVERVAMLQALPAQVEATLGLDAEIVGLKLKEISYIHAEGYPAGELKHGPIALIEPGVPVVAIATACHVRPKMLSNIQEVRARGASVIAVATEGDEEIRGLADHVLYVPRVDELLSPVVVSVPLQLFAYRIAKIRGCDVDQPRNLAKSVTVE
jgi:glucosamine--fructose-6-phosphate aminotransferase (isomerizing)